METTTLPAFGSPEFWEFYDEFCKPENLEKFISDLEVSDDASGKMHLIMHAAHLTREIHKLKRPEKGWKNHHAWLALKHAPIQRHDGNIFTSMSRGDVITVAHQWDRDIMITHNPISEHVCGYLLGGKWEPMIGLFMPLFDKKTIMTCIELRCKKNLAEALEKAKEESATWYWYE
ncbi:MAG: hypothetical protein V4686_02720 [Patescibacteria group bacterium]